MQKLIIIYAVGNSRQPHFLSCTSTGFRVFDVFSQDRWASQCFSFKLRPNTLRVSAALRFPARWHNVGACAVCRRRGADVPSRCGVIPCRATEATHVYHQRIAAGRRRHPPIRAQGAEPTLTDARRLVCGGKRKNILCDTALINVLNAVIII